jgi:hypothetical protein
MRFAEALRMVLAVLLLVLVASPVLRDATDDSFPLSTYPMFARLIERPWLTIAQGEDAKGARQSLPPEVVASVEPMQAMRTLLLAARQGRRPLSRLCAQIAKRVVASPRHAAVQRVHIVRARFNPLTYFERAPQPEQVEALTTCKVSREP